MTDFTLIITCYNEKLYLLENLERIRKILNKVKLSYKIIIIDDCSTDSTPELIRTFQQSARDMNIQTIFHCQNQGRGASVTEGLLLAESDIAGFLDIDLEISEDYILNAYLQIYTGLDLVIGQRYYNMTFHPKSILRYFLSLGYRFLVTSWLSLPGLDTESGFKFFNMKTMRGLISCTRERGWFWDTEIVARAYRKRMKILKLPCLFLRNTLKNSSVKLRRDIPYYLVKLYGYRKTLKQI